MAKGHKAWNKGMKLPEFSGEKHPRWTGKYIHKCIECDKQFHNRHTDSKYCSNKCKYNSPKWKKLGHSVGELSTDSWNKGERKYKQNCLCCKTKFHTSDKRNKFCSLICYRNYNTGTKHYNWKGGISRGYKLGYWSSEYKQWRQAVFERDNYLCLVCNIGGKLNAHHILEFAKYPEYRFDVDNGFTLHERCHLTLGLHGGDLN